MALLEVLAPAGGGAEEEPFVEGPGYLLYLPYNRPSEEWAPLVFALSPTAEPHEAIKPWMEVADSRGWYIAASKEFQNGVDFGTLAPGIERAIEEIRRKYRTDPERLILTGFSGGGMGAFFFAERNPRMVRAVVTDCGRMHWELKSFSFPKGKTAVFLAARQDHNYEAMKEDKEFLDSRGWTTHWIEREGGHAYAPRWIYEQAAQRLETEW